MTSPRRLPVIGESRRVRSPMIANTSASVGVSLALSSNPSRKSWNFFSDTRGMYFVPADVPLAVFALFGISAGVDLPAGLPVGVPPTLFAGLELQPQMSKVVISNHVAR